MTDVKKRILVVDDQPDAVAGITAMLEAGGHEVSSASDGDSGFATARNEKPDLIILDVQMPGKDGFTTFHQLRQEEATKNIPVLFLTAVGERTGVHFSADSVGEFVGSEPEGYIEKPVDPDRLTATVKKILGS